MSACRPPRPAQKVTASIGARPGGQVRGGSTLQATPAGARPTRQRQRFSLLRLGSSRRTPRQSKGGLPQPLVPPSAPRTSVASHTAKRRTTAGSPRPGETAGGGQATSTRDAGVRKNKCCLFLPFFPFFFSWLGVAGRAQPRRCLFFFLGRPSLFLPTSPIPRTHPPPSVCVCQCGMDAAAAARLFPITPFHTRSPLTHSTPLTRPLRPSAAPPARRPAPAGARPPTPAPRPPPRAPGRHSAPTTTRTRSA